VASQAGALLAGAAQDKTGGPAVAACLGQQVEPAGRLIRCMSDGSGWVELRYFLVAHLEERPVRFGLVVPAAVPPGAVLVIAELHSAEPAGFVP
jgi:hypothetical protein